LTDAVFAETVQPGTVWGATTTVQWCRALVPSIDWY